MEKFEKMNKDQLLEEINHLKLENTQLKVDISELTNKKEFSQIVVDNTSDVITISSFNLKAVYLYVSPSIKQNMGYVPEDLVGKSFFDFIHPDDRKNILVILKKYLGEVLKKIIRIDGLRINESIEYRFKDKSGNWHYTQSTINFYGNKLLAISRDITEQKEAQKAILLSEDRFRVLYNNSPDMYVSVSPKDGSIMQCNETLLIETGYSKEEIIGSKTFEIYHNDCIPDAKKAFKQFVETGRVKDKELILRKKDGSKIFVSLNVNAVRDKSGEIIQSISTLRNITEHKILEDAFRKSEAKVNNILNTIDDIVFVFDKENRFVSVNKSDEELFLPKEKFLGKTISEVMPPHVNKLFMAALPKVQSGKTDGYEYQLDMLGETYWFSVKLSALFDNDKYIGLVAITRDITIRKRNEDQLANSEEEHRSIFNGANDGILLVDKNLNILNVNPAFTEITGILKEDVIGKSSIKLARKLLSIKELPNVLSHVSSLFSKKPFIPYTLKYRDKFLEISVRKQVSGKIVGIIRDISGRKKAEELLKYHFSKLEERNEELDAFSHTVAHDLRNPVGTILGFAELLRDNYPIYSQDEKQRDINAIIKSGKKMQEIINSLLLLASVRQSEINTTELNMGEIVKEVINRLDHLIKKNNTTIDVRGSLPTAWGYATWVEEVWVNYLSNAIKYGGKPPKIEIGADLSIDNSTSKKMVKFWVKDNGPGISTENQKLLFNKFERLDQVKTEGYGLGLSIVRRIITKLEGKVGMVSDTSWNSSSDGSTFFFTLPAPINDDSETTTKNKSKIIYEHLNHKLTKKLKILIAEDEETSDEFLTIILNDISRETLHSETGTEAIEICHNNPDIDLILMDIKMSGMDGYEACSKIREFNKDVIIIAQTAYALAGDREKSIDAGCDDYIAKPIDKEELIEMIRKHINKE